MYSKKQYLAVAIILAIGILSSVNCDDRSVNKSVKDAVEKATTTMEAVPDLCPCVPHEYCPRIMGTTAEDAKYLGEILKCPKVGHIRCCGVKASEIKRLTRKMPMIVTSSKQMPDGYIINLRETTSISTHARPSPTGHVADEPTTLSSSDESVATTDTTESIMNEFEEFGSFKETTTEYTTEFARETTTDASDPTTIDPMENTAEDMVNKQIDSTKTRRPKLVDNVIMVYPNEMSGVPKTTPKNMPAESASGMQMFDDDMGMDLHVIFSTNQTTALPPVVMETLDTSKMSELAPSGLASEEIEYGSRIAALKTTIPESTTPEYTNTTPHKSKPKRRRFTPYKSKPAKAATDESDATTPVTKRPSRVTQTPNSVAAPNKSRFKPRVRTIKRKPTAAPETDDVLSTIQTTSTTESSVEDNDATEKSEMESVPNRTTNQKPRKQLFNSANRLNFLRRKASEATTTEAPPATETSRPSAIVMKALDKEKKKALDSEHKFIMERVRHVIKTTNAKGSIKSIPRTFSGSAASNRVEGLEKMVARKISNTLKEMTKKPAKDIVQEENTNRKPFRGSQRFLSSTPINAARSRSRLPTGIAATKTSRTATIKPGNKPGKEVRVSKIDREVRVSTIERKRKVRPQTTKAPKIVQSTTQRKRGTTTTTAIPEIEPTNKPKSPGRRIKVQRRKTFRGRNANRHRSITTTAEIITEETTESVKATRTPTSRPSTPSAVRPSEEPTIATPTSRVSLNNKDVFTFTDRLNDDESKKNSARQDTVFISNSVKNPFDMPFSSAFPDTTTNPLVEAVKEAIFRRSTTWSSNLDDQFPDDVLPPPRNVQNAAIATPTTSFQPVFNHETDSSSSQVLFRPSQNQLASGFAPAHQFPINGHQKPHPLDIIGPVPTLKNFTPDENRIRFGLPAEIQRTQFFF